MEIKVDTYYKTRSGHKAYVEYKRIRDESNPYKGYYIYADMGSEEIQEECWSEFGRGGGFDQMCDCDLVALWEDEPEEIDVSSTWRQITEKNGTYGEDGVYYPNKENMPIKSITIAVVTSAEWIEIQQGKRKLVVGEGL